MKILYEDNHLLAIDKPPGLLTQPTPQEAESLETLAKEWIKTKYSKPGAVFLEAVHRIDRPVSGIVLFAKTSKACKRLNRSIRDKAVKKEYIALVEGVLNPREGVLEHYLIHEEHRSRVGRSDELGAKPAVLHYKTLKEGHGRSLLAIDLVTGRYHQIRAQLAACGTPIVGDTKYGSKQATAKGSIFLHHVRMTFPHPISNEIITISSEEEFVNLF